MDISKWEKREEGIAPIVEYDSLREDYKRNQEI